MAIREVPPECGTCCSSSHRAEPSRVSPVCSLSNSDGKRYHLPFTHHILLQGLEVSPQCATVDFLSNVQRILCTGLSSSPLLSVLTLVKELVSLINEKKYSWLAGVCALVVERLIRLVVGVVYGPHTAWSLPHLRTALAADIPIRQYPGTASTHPG